MQSSVLQSFFIYLLACLPGAPWAGGPLAAQSDSIPGAQATYAGRYAVGSTVGEATFELLVRERDSILAGPFSWVGGGPRFTNDGAFERASYKGNYEEGRPTGAWTLRHGRFTPSGVTELNGYALRIPLNGDETTAAGTIENGKPTGEWTHTTQSVEQGAPGAVTFQSTITFAGGVAQRDFRLENSAEEVLLGRFDREGRAVDAWTVYQDLEESEIWTFVEGRLQSVARPGAALAEDIPVFAANVGEMRPVPLDAAYLRTLSIYQRMNERSDAFTRRSGAALLRANAAAYNRTSAALDTLGAPAFAPTFEVLVPDHPLPPGQLLRLAAIARNTGRAQAAIDQVLSAPNLAVVSRSDAVAERAAQHLRALRSETLPPLNRLVENYETGVLGNLPLAEYLAFLWPGGEAAGAGSLGEGPGTGSGRSFEIAAGGLEEVLALSEDLLTVVNTQRAILREKINTQPRRQVVVALEDRLAYEFQLLDSLIRSQGRRSIKRYNLNQIRDLAQADIQAYNSGEGGLDDDERATRVIGCLEAYEALIVAVTELPLQAEAIEARYTDQVWNNFTATLMDETVKRRLADAYTDVLVPYFTASATEALTCDSATRLQYEITTTHERMLALRNQDTGDLENELRGVEDPRTILNLIGVTAPQK